ncbi:MAG TPA: YbjN domain-containing protein, partial [Acidimicrobiales bacterium]|nr:YbjN domain-containing protein [Acidimicrobiales bacterium]
ALATLFSASAVDVHHGSRRAEHEAQEKLAALRRRLVPLLTQMLGRPPTQDPDGDYVFRYQSATVFVAPRAAPNGVVVLRVFAITNVGVNVGPELALFLARLNFSLAFGRFTLDVEHQAVWFDETLLGDKADDEELEFAIEVVASTADEWDDRIKAMFGGSTGEDVAASKAQGIAPPPKPGEGGYL